MMIFLSPKPIVLIVEDDSALREMYTERLRAERFKVVVASDGEEAVHEAIISKPDLILLDLMLPRQGGLSVLKVLKSLPETQNVPIIVLTAYAKDEYRTESLRGGAVEFLLKAETKPGEVIAKIKEILGR